MKKNTQQTDNNSSNDNEQNFSDRRGYFENLTKQQPIPAKKSALAPQKITPQKPIPPTPPQKQISTKQSIPPASSQVQINAKLSTPSASPQVQISAKQSTPSALLTEQTKVKPPTPPVPPRKQNAKQSTPPVSPREQINAKPATPPLSPREQINAKPATPTPSSRDEITNNLTNGQTIQKIEPNEDLGKRLSKQQDLIPMITKFPKAEENQIKSSPLLVQPLRKRSKSFTSKIKDTIQTIRSNMQTSRSRTPELQEEKKASIRVTEQTSLTDLKEKEIELQRRKEELAAWETKLKTEQESMAKKQQNSSAVEKQLQEKYKEIQQMLQENSDLQKKLTEEKKEIEQSKLKVNEEQTRILLDFVNNNNVVKITEYLERGFDPNTKDPKGQTLLHYAAIKQKTDIVQLLLNNIYKKANPNIQDNNGNLALHLAMESRDVNLIKLFIWTSEDTCICNVKIKNKDGKTAIQQTANNDHEIEKTLREAEQEADRVYNKTCIEIDCELQGLNNKKNFLLTSSGDTTSVKNYLLTMADSMEKGISSTILLPEQKAELIKKISEFRESLIQDLSVKQISSSPQQTPLKKERSQTTSNSRSRPKLVFSLSSSNVNQKYKQDLIDIQGDKKDMNLMKK